VSWVALDLQQLQCSCHAFTSLPKLWYYRSIFRALIQDFMKHRPSGFISGSPWIPLLIVVGDMGVRNCFWQQFLWIRFWHFWVLRLEIWNSFLYIISWKRSVIFFERWIKICHNKYEKLFGAKMYSQFSFIKKVVIFY